MSDQPTLISARKGHIFEDLAVLEGYFEADEGNISEPVILAFQGVVGQFWLDERRKYYEAQDGPALNEFAMVECDYDSDWVDHKEEFDAVMTLWARKQFSERHL